MASIVLPTFEWTASCEQLGEQLTDEDELLVVCDHGDDPVASVELPASAELLIAGDPVGCSGKANAVAHALERVRQDRIIITDDDVERDPDWLATMKRLGDEHGAATAIPVFVSDEYPFRLFEPLAIVVASLVLERSTWVPWGGGVTFDRRDIDMQGYIADLRQTVSDDGLLSRYLDRIVASHEVINIVRVPGDTRSTYERLTRFVKIFYRFEPGKTLGVLLFFLAVLVLGTVAPWVLAIGVTAVAWYRYRLLGVDRVTWMFAVPSLVLAPFIGIAGLLRPTFVWGGRRYRWPDTFEVTVLPPEPRGALLTASIP